ncbi:hypothetical protein ACTXJ3_12265 [Brachybacterium paraconglomeratum]|uniref:hypothetical protein n=1 Tax=Brachybacterium paraconglomeratum TaxID=173362 RepID=UPI003FD3D01A
MSDGESTTPAPRKRPSFGLPGPTTPGPGADPQQGAPAHDPDGQAPQQGYDQASYGTSFADGPQTGALPPSALAAPRAGDPSAPGPGRSGRSGRRRGVLPLVIGLVLLLVIAPAATIVGIVWSLGSLVGDASEGPTPMEASTATLELSANEMVIVYVPATDAATAECTAEGADPGAVTTVPSSTATTFGNGEEYVQVLGVASLQDTTATISCTGTDAPAHLGPYSLFGMMVPLVIGPIIGVVAGLAGLVLTIVGIVLLVRSRRA